MQAGAGGGKMKRHAGRGTVLTVTTVPEPTLPTAAFAAVATVPEPTLPTAAFAAVATVPDPI
jgi:hypothetical protein